MVRRSDAIVLSAVLVNPVQFKPCFGSRFIRRYNVKALWVAPMGWPTCFTRTFARAQRQPGRSPRLPAICRVCGVSVKSGWSYCARCASTVSREGLIEAAKPGRVAGHSPEARARQAEKQRRHAAAKRSWQASSQPVWLDKESYLRKIQPLLCGFKVSVISAALGISEPYAAEVRAGRYLPHPWHWLTLAGPVAVPPDVQGGSNGSIGQFRHN